MKKRHLTKTIICILCIGLIFVLSGCSSKYGENDFLGKTSSQIESEFGAFDCIGKPSDADGLYRSTFCGYTVKEAHPGYLDTEPEKLVFISFDDEGIAVRVYEDYRPGG